MSSALKLNSTRTQGIFEQREKIETGKVLIVGGTQVAFAAAQILALLGVQKIYVSDGSRPIEGATHFHSNLPHGKKRAHLMTGLPNHISTTTEFELISGNTQTYVPLVDVVLVVDLPLSILMDWNTICRTHQKPFVAARCLGLLATVFVDAGPKSSFLKSSAGTIWIKDIQEDGLVTFGDGAINVGDQISFCRRGDEQNCDDLPPSFRVTKLATCSSFHIPTKQMEELRAKNMGGYCYRGGATIQKEAVYQEMQFVPISETLVRTDERIFWRCFQEYDNFVAQHGALPKPRSQADKNAFLDQIQSRFTLRKDEIVILSKFCDTCTGTLAPFANEAAAIAANEILKLLTKKFELIQGFQWLNQFDTHYYALSAEDCHVKPSVPFAEQIRIIGQKNQALLENANIFIIGTGAVGSCVLKDLVCMGAGRKGTITIVDFDHVGEANLMGQLLFVAKDVKHKTLKVHAAVQRLKELGYTVNINPYPMKVSPQTEKHFLPLFQKADILISAVDSRDAREYLENIAHRVTIQNGTPLVWLEGGIGGTRGTGIVSIPFKTSPFVDRGTDESKDPTQIQCLPTSFLKTSTEAIRHAAEQFQLYFTKHVEMVNRANQESRDQVPATFKDIFNLYLPLYRNQPQEWAVSLFNDIFCQKIEESIAKYAEYLEMYQEEQPEDFSAAIKVLQNPPTPLKYNPEDPQHVGFVAAVVAVLGQMSDSVPFSPQTPFQIVPFDKDDDIHLELVYQMSLGLCKCFKITPQDREYVRRVAGKITSAIISTTELVSSTICLNVLNVLAKNEEGLREPMFDTSQADYCLKYLVQQKSPLQREAGKPEVYSYEKMNFSRNDSMSEFLRSIESKYDLGIDQLMVYPENGSFGVIKSRQALDSTDISFFSWVKTLAFFHPSLTEVVIHVMADCTMLQFRMVVSLKDALPLLHPVGHRNDRGICFFNTAVQALVPCREWLEYIKQIDPCSMTQPVAFGLSRFLWGDMKNTALYDHFAKFFPSRILPVPRDNYKDPSHVLQTLEEGLIKEARGTKDLLKAIGFTLTTKERCLQCGDEKIVSGPECFRIIRNIFVDRQQSQALNPQSILDPFAGEINKCPKCGQQSLKSEQSIVGENKNLIISVVNNERTIRVNPDLILAVPQNSGIVYYELVGSTFWTGSHHFGATRFSQDLFNGWTTVDDEKLEGTQISNLLMSPNQIKLLTYRRCEDQNPQNYATIQIQVLEGAAPLQFTYFTCRDSAKWDCLVKDILLVAEDLRCPALEEAAKNNKIKSLEGTILKWRKKTELKPEERY